MKACATLNEAREFLAIHGSGAIEKRAYKLLHHSGYGFERVEYDPPIRIDDWQFVERIDLSKTPSDNAEVTQGFKIESDYPLASDWLPAIVFTNIYPTSSAAIVVAMEGVDDPEDYEVRVMDMATGKVVWRSTEEGYQ